MIQEASRCEIGPILNLQEHSALRCNWQDRDGELYCVGLRRPGRIQVKCEACDLAWI
jgi:hypothetical protein